VRDRDNKAGVDDGRIDGTGGVGPESNLDRWIVGPLDKDEPVVFWIESAEAGSDTAFCQLLGGNMVFNKKSLSFLASSVLKATSFKRLGSPALV